MKYLVLFIVLALAYGLWRSKNRRTRPPSPQTKNHTPPPLPVRPPPAGAVQDMVPCAHCQLHLPRCEALVHNAQFYCCEEHRRSSGE
jgi:uncharacterized protein